MAFRLGQETHQILFEFQQTRWASRSKSRSRSQDVSSLALYRRRIPNRKCQISLAKIRNIPFVKDIILLNDHVNNRRFWLDHVRNIPWSTITFTSTNLMEKYKFKWRTVICNKKKIYCYLIYFLLLLLLKCFCNAVSLFYGHANKAHCYCCCYYDYIGLLCGKVECSLCSMEYLPTTLSECKPACFISEHFVSDFTVFFLNKRERSQV